MNDKGYKTMMINAETHREIKELAFLMKIPMMELVAILVRTFKDLKDPAIGGYGGGNGDDKKMTADLSTREEI